MVIKVTLLFKNYPARLPDIPEKVSQSSRPFWEKRVAKTHLSTPDPARDFTGLYEKARQGYWTFSK